ncbi:PAC2 family protein [Desulfobacterales bacterium HSG2]|nr:PAC2 family protein [Desulfobacterales bacterium HSG2]
MEQGIIIKKLPKLKKPLLIAGFGGWGNALDVSKGMVEYLVRNLKAKYIAGINPDVFFRYDAARPLADIEDGVLNGFMPPGGAFYAARTSSTDSDASDIVILETDEPNLRWFQFSDEFFSLCTKLGVETVITLGSMYDNILHSDRIISVIASDEALLSGLKPRDVIPINYQGPSAIHSIIQSEGQKRGFGCISLWCHCPFYLEGVVHYGILCALCDVLESLGGFELDTEEFDAGWKELNEKIETAAEDDPELRDIINDIRQTRVEGRRAGMKQSVKGEKVIDLKDFLDPR